MANSTTTYKAKKATTLANPNGTASVFTQSDSASLASYCAIPGAASSGQSLIDGGVIYLRMSGNVVIGSAGASTFTPQIWWSTNARTTTAVTNATAVAGTASTSLSASTNYPWFLETELVWSNASLLLGGYYSQYVGIASGLTTQTITTSNVLSSIDLTVNTSGFLASALMGTSRSGTVVTLSEFILEVL